MKLINPSVQYLPQAPGMEGIYKQIELVGRTCYKSQDKITEDSAEPFVNRMMKSQHYAMLEHGTVYLKAPSNYPDDVPLTFVRCNPHTVTTYVANDDYIYITTNLRVLAEYKAMHLLDKYLCEPTEHHAKRITLKFITSRAIANEIVRHRAFSFAQESTRYCNYSKDKFGKELTFMIPSWTDIKEGEYTWKEYFVDDFIDTSSPINNQYIAQLLCSEKPYFELLRQGCKPQEARDILPLALKTELVMTGLEDDYKHFFDLRYRGTTGAPHPDMQILAAMAHETILRETGKDL